MNASNNCNVSVHPPPQIVEFIIFQGGIIIKITKTINGAGREFHLTHSLSRNEGGEIQFSQHGFPQTVQRGAKFNRGKFSNFFAGNNNNNRNCNGISFNSLSRKVKRREKFNVRPRAFPPSPLFPPPLCITCTKFTGTRSAVPPATIYLHFYRAARFTRAEAEQREFVRGGERERERKWSSRRMHGVVSIFAHAWTGLCAERRGEESSACLKFLVHTVGMV